MLLLGSDVDSMIEFGAQQCVIVRNTESKTKIPDSLKRGAIVCSVFEAKGLVKIVVFLSCPVLSCLVLFS